MNWKPWTYGIGGLLILGVVLYFIFRKKTAPVGVHPPSLNPGGGFNQGGTNKPAGSDVYSTAPGAN
jgi:hypothetical protein